MITIKDVAKYAGVSIATVSRVINGNNRVSEEVRKKVLKAIRELGYKPKPHYSLNGELLRTIGVLLPDLGGYHYSEILSGIEEYAFENNFDVMVSLTRSVPDIEKEILDEYFRRKVDGVIVCTLRSDEKLLEKFVNSGVPVVAVDSRIDELRADSVNIDNFSGAYHVMRYLYEHHHKKILYVPGPSNVYASYEREKGIEKFLSKYRDVEFSSCNIRGFNPDTGYTGVKNNLKKYGKNFTAIFSVNDYVALGVITALNEAGLKIPEDVSLISFDDAPFASYTVPPLTTVSQPRWQMGRIGARILIEKLSNQLKKILRTVVLPTHIVERKSVSTI
ncbi:LacI family DNA-binding transcriptional regulator [Pseudothermotoga elfii]